jgi:hypothetical protein
MITGFGNESSEYLIQVVHDMMLLTCVQSDALVCRLCVARSSLWQVIAVPSADVLSMAGVTR